MEKPILISEMYKFHFGSKIFCSDGEDGVLAQVGFDAAQTRMSYIAVRLGRFFGKNVYLPFDTVTSASGDGISLRITRAELAAASKNELGGAILDAKSVVEC